jgi:hypothetical protein
VDTSDNDHLIGHMYKEGDSKKGGNSVASLLLKTLRHLNIIQFDDEGNPITGGELNIVFDNCAGQNKNNYVLWLVPYLVEARWFKHVNFIFLVVGHTKNACDRRFNNVKQVYNKSNIYSFDMCTEVCNQSDHVTILPVEDGDIRDWQSWFVCYYKRLNEIKIRLSDQQIFSCCSRKNNWAECIINLTV